MGVKWSFCKAKWTYTRKTRYFVGGHCSGKQSSYLAVGYDMKDKKQMRRQSKFRGRLGREGERQAMVDDVGGELLLPGFR